jgi:metal-responsive CopG/Arc/MetJ family transcriptional regulator
MKREHISITLPAAMKRQIDALVGRRGRGAFLREAAEQELERKRLLASLRKGPARLAR